MTAGGSAASHARALRGGWRGAVRRQVRAWLGMRPSRADQRARRFAHGAAGEKATAVLLAGLKASGWHVKHDLRVPGRRFNLDHVLVAPSGAGIVVLDTKAWQRGRPTTLDYPQPGRTALSWRTGGVWVELWHDEPARPAPRPTPTLHAAQTAHGAPSARLPFTRLRNALTNAKENRTA